MKITELSVHNYKSLRSISFAPGDLNIIVGANASGKSNFADALDFISEIYRHGLEVAVARKGGYENIAFRRKRRSKGAIGIDLCVEIPGSELRGGYNRSNARNNLPTVRVKHRFQFAAKGYSISAEFAIVSETLTFSIGSGQTWEEVAAITRSQHGTLTLAMPSNVAAEDLAEHPVSRKPRKYFDFPELQYFFQREFPASPTELISSMLGRFTSGMSAFTTAVGNIRVFQISPTKSREFGVPTPRPELAFSGANLPAVVDLLQKKRPAEWKQVMQAMRSVMPDLSAIQVAYTPNRTLGLFFEEEGSGRPWSVGEVSDGTIQTLALLVAIFDPQSTALVLEEPENSVHPWIIRHILDSCKEASKRKQILITTHSPIVMNAVHPDELWIMWRRAGESHLSPLKSLDSQFVELWSDGQIPTFEYLDSGALPTALPPSPSDEVD